MRREPAAGPGEEDALGFWQRLGDAVGEEAVVERQLVRAQVRGGPARRTCWAAGRALGRTRLAGGRDDQGARAAAGVLARSASWRRSRTRWARAASPCGSAGVGIGQGDQPVGDLLARQPLTNLACDDAGARGQLLQTPSGGELAPGAATAGPSAQVLGQPERLADRALDQRAGLAGQPQRGRLALTGARCQRLVEIALAPADRRERYGTRGASEPTTVAASRASASSRRLPGRCRSGSERRPRPRWSRCVPRARRSAARRSSRWRSPRGRSRR